MNNKKEDIITQRFLYGAIITASIFLTFLLFKAQEKQKENTIDEMHKLYKIELTQKTIDEIKQAEMDKKALLDIINNSEVPGNKIIDFETAVRENKFKQDSLSKELDKQTKQLDNAKVKINVVLNHNKKKER